MKKKKLKKEIDSLLSDISSNESKLRVAEICIIEKYSTIEELKRINEMTEKHLQIAEKELQAKERIILELKTWIGDLHRSEVM